MPQIFVQIEIMMSMASSSLHLKGLFLFIVFALAFVVLVLLFVVLQPLVPFDLVFVLPPFCLRLTLVQSVAGLLVGEFVGAVLIVGLCRG